jgi:hypothetical protein
MGRESTAFLLLKEFALPFDVFRTKILRLGGEVSAVGMSRTAAECFWRKVWRATTRI